jgi:hypothetical protein
MCDMKYKIQSLVVTTYTDIVLLSQMINIAVEWCMLRLILFNH